MRLLQSGDWHGDWVTRGVSRFDEIARAAQQTVNVAIEQKVDLYVFLGDARDPGSGAVAERVSAMMIALAVQLHKAGIPSVWIAGNHDVYESGDGTTTITPLRGLSLLQPAPVVVFENPFAGIWKFDERLLLPLAVFPFTAATNAYDPLDVVKTMPENAIVLSHLGVPGIIPGEETLEMPRGRNVMLPVTEILEKRPRFIGQGHFHRRQITEDGVHIPGSLCRLTFSEENYEPGFQLVEI